VVLRTTTKKGDQTSMLTGEEDMQATALRARGWSVSAIARHLGRDRKTVRDYLSGKRIAGERRRPEPDPFDAIAAYAAQRLADDAHVWASALYDEVVALGYPLSYQSFTRSLRERRLRPHCEACAGVKGRDTIDIPHPPGAEIQWDWDELPDAPWGGDAHLLLGTLAYSGKFRGVFAEAEEQGHVISGIDTVLRALGGTARGWRFDRMATVVEPASGRLRASFAPVAKHYSVSVVACPPRRGNRKGSVEKSVHYATQRFWRTMTASTMAAAQAQLGRFCEKIADRRARPAAKLEEVLGAGEAAAYLSARGLRCPTVGLLAGFEGLLGLPAGPYPATVEAPRTVSPGALVSFEGNFYGLPPGFSGQVVTVRHRLGSGQVEVVSAGGVILASHPRAVPGAGRLVRHPADKVALEKAVLAQFTCAAPCRRKANRPPSPAARAEAAKVLSAHHDPDVVVDLAVYQRLVDEMATVNNEDATAVDNEEANDER
jgi:transposase